MYLYGNTGVDYGSASVTLNGAVVASSLNLTVSYQCERQTDAASSDHGIVVMTCFGSKMASTCSTGAHWF
jgi:hypothetical protein